ncbi:MAG: NAD(P)-dependent oxidoreductase [Verrucomicrobia bacterium]|nr:NAD(P)-dependent oxidoreductase [Verrucomicrobiota bacterium]
MNHTTETALGFLGLGAMGGPMARRLLAAGHRVQVFDLSPERLAAVVRAGGEPASEAAAVVRQAAVVFTSLPTNEVFLAVAAEVLLPHARPGQVFVDLGTTIPGETRRLAAAFAAVGATLLDVPVSGGGAGAENGRLRMFAGGDEAVFRQVRPLLVILGGADRITYCGPSGCGQIAKGVNQLKSALGTAAMVEALAFAVRAGVPAATIAAAFGAGSPEEASGIVKYARAVAANPDAHFGIKFRELPYYLAEAQAGGFSLPLTAALHAYCDRGERVVIDDGRPAPSFWRELRLR